MEQPPLLSSEWTWYAHCKSASYASGCVTVGQMSTVVDFWRHFHHTPSVGNFVLRTVTANKMPLHGYGFFRDGVLPEWEHPRNREGGEFILRILAPADLESLWLDLLLGCIGGQAPVVGIRCIAKLPIKIEVWYDGDTDAAAVRAWIDARIVGKRVTIAAHKLHAAMAI